MNIIEERLERARLKAELMECRDQIQALERTIMRQSHCIAAWRGRAQFLLLSVVVELAVVVCIWVRR